MADHLSVKARSAQMARIGSRHTMPELTVRRMVHGMGFRFRLHREDLPGRPDLVFPGKRKVIFVHGCFWHGHTCPRGARVPGSNRPYWIAKINRNRERDQRSIEMLAESGWAALTIWECQLKEPDMVRRRLVEFLGP